MSRISILLTMALALRAGDPVPPVTSPPLTITQPLDEAMVDGIHRYCDRAKASASQTRERKWRPAEFHPVTTAAAGGASGFCPGRLRCSSA